MVDIKVGEAYAEIYPKVDTSAFSRSATQAGEEFSDDLKRKLASEGHSIGTATSKEVSEGFRKQRIDVDGTFESSGKSGGGAFHRGFKGAVAGLASVATAAFAGAQVIDFMKDAVAEAREAEKVGKLTAAVIESTGGAANVSKKHVEDYANKLSLLAGVDDEVIQNGQNMLLTFTNIKNGVGDGNDVFDQATGAALDMSVAMGEDLQSSAIRLGKALNDPIGGVGALRRVGVQLTDQQETQIKTMMASGDVMGAQKVILGELSKEFGGAAAAGANSGDKAKVAWENMKETLGTALLPVLDKVATFFGNTIAPGITALIGGIQGAKTETGGFSGVMETLGRVIRTVSDAIGSVVKFMKEHKDLMGVLVPIILTVVAAIKIMTIVQAAWNAVMMISPIGLIIIAVAALVVGIIQLWKHSETFRDIVIGVWHAIQTAALSFWHDFLEPILNALKAAWIAVSEAFSWYWENVVKVVFKAIIDFATGLPQWFRDRWNEVTAAFGAAFDWIRTAWHDITEWFKTAWNDVKQWIIDRWEDIKNTFAAAIEIIRGAWEVYVNFFKDAFNVVKDFIHDRWEDIKGFFRDAINFIKDRWNDAVQSYKDAWNSVKDWFHDRWEDIKGFFGDAIQWVRDRWSDATQFFKDKWDDVKNWFHDRWEDIKGFFADAAQWVKDKWHDAVEFVKEKFGGMFDKAKTAFDDVVRWAETARDKIQDAFGRVGEFFRNIWRGLEDAAKGPLNWIIRGINRALDGINGAIKLYNSVPGVPNLPEIGFRLTELASGGLVTGRGTSTSDSIPAMLSNGEYVVRASAVDRIGVHNLNRLNAGMGMSGQQDTYVTVMLDGEIVDAKVATGVAANNAGAIHAMRTRRRFK